MNPRFVVHEHDASRLHYDFRLERTGFCGRGLSPKALPWTPRKKGWRSRWRTTRWRYIDFEGTIPEGEYGAGTVGVWDHGTYTPLLEKAGGDQILAERREAPGEFRPGEAEKGGERKRMAPDQAQGQICPAGVAAAERPSFPGGQEAQGHCLQVLIQQRERRFHQYSRHAGESRGPESNETLNSGFRRKENQINFLRDLR